MDCPNNILFIIILGFVAHLNMTTIQVYFFIFVHANADVLRIQKLWQAGEVNLLGKYVENNAKR
jgi:hypothetical protein